MKVKGQLAQMHKRGLVEECDKFCAEINSMHSTCSGYLEVCTRPLQYLSYFMWTVVSETPKWNDVEPCVKYLTGAN